MPSPTPDRFRGLARSSPWRWRALTFDLHRRPLHGPDHTVTALVERGVGLDVRLADGERRRDPARRNIVGMSYLGDVIAGQTPWSCRTRGRFRWRSTGTVSSCGGPPSRATSDDPIWQDYQFVAMLDPVELADGQWRYGPPDSHVDAVPDAVLPPALDVHRLDATVRSGRQTWWAEVSPREEYEPRCSCCPLLFGRVSESLEAAAGGPTALDRDPDLVYASAYLVALDVQTGVCVHLEHLDGDHAGRGFSVDIHSMDGDVAK